MKRRNALLLTILLLALALRIHGVFAFPVEQDELYTLRDARYLGDVLSVKPVYYFLAHLILQIVPPDPVWLRVPAFLFGMAGVWVTWRLGRRIFGPTAGAVAAFLVAVSPWHIYASQFGRYWSLVYLLAAVLYLALYEAIDRDRVRAYLGVVGLGWVGVLSHPTFAFPLLGAVVGASIPVGENPSSRPHWPSRRFVLSLWVPLLALMATGLVLLLLTGHGSALLNNRGRGLSATLRLVPAMVQWAGPILFAAGALGIGFQLSSARDRRWGMIAAFACICTFGALVLASFVTDVYADYGISMLPLLYVAIGGATQRFSEALPARRGGFAVATTVVLTAGVFPSVASHLTDGTRFDYRPVYRYIRQIDTSRPIVGWPKSVHEYYAPELRFLEIPRDSTSLATLEAEEAGFWFVVSNRRYGAVGLSPEASAWLREHCRRALAVEKGRLDYRTYRVELYRCGSEPRATGRSG